MADSAHAEATAAGSGSPPGIKQEPTTLVDLPDLSLALESLTSKRPLESTEDKDGAHDDQANKRIKTEAEHQEVQAQPEPEPEPSFDGMNLEDDMALLVSNALSNANDMMQQYSEEPQTQEQSAEPMDLDNSILPDLPRTLPDFDLEPHQFLRVGSIRALGNLAVSILLILSRTPFDHALSSIRDEDAEHKRAFDDARAAFLALKQIYGQGDVLSATDAGLDDTESQNIMHMANLAQLGVWLAECTTATLSTANAVFLRLLPTTSNLTDDVVDLLLAIKTQLAVHSISAEATAETHQSILNHVLQDGLEEALRARREGQDLSVTEQHLLTSVEVRKAGFSTDVQTPEGVAALKDKYPLTQLSKSLGIYFRNQLSSFSELALTLGLTVPADDDLPEMLGLPEDNVVAGLDMDEDLSSFFEKTTSGLVQDALAAFKGEITNEAATEAPSTNGANGTGEAPPDAEAPARQAPRSDYEELEALVAQSTSDYVKNTLNSMSPMSYVPQSTGDGMASQTSYLTHLQQNLAQHQYFPFSQPQPEAPPQPSGSGDNLPPNQTCPSAMLYDKARQAALSKSSAHTRREGLHSTRRPWTQEEEKALMAGLDMVKGPHWSQILTLFGPHGTISDILKDRTQVQLKDKARNLKLFFLKTNSEMPYYLQAVTGELKTRAPTQAARKEAEERARMNSEEDQAKLQGIMALAGGLQHHTQHQQVQQGHYAQQAKPAPRPLGAVGAGIITPAQAAAQAASSNGQQPGAAQTAWRPNGQIAPNANTAQRTAQQPGAQQMVQGAVQGQAQQANSQGQQPAAQIPRPNNTPQGQQPQHTHAHPQPQQRPQGTPQTTQTPGQPTNGQQSQAPHQPIRPAQSIAPAQQNQAVRPQQYAQQAQAPRLPQQQPTTTQGQAQGQVQSSPHAGPRPSPQGGVPQAQHNPGQPAANIARQSPSVSTASTPTNRPQATQGTAQATGTAPQPAQQQTTQLMMPKPSPSPSTGQVAQQQPQLRPQQAMPTTQPQAAAPASAQQSPAQAASQNGLVMPRPQQSSPAAQPSQTQAQSQGQQTQQAHAAPQAQTQPPQAHVQQQQQQQQQQQPQSHMSTEQARPNGHAQPQSQQQTQPRTQPAQQVSAAPSQETLVQPQVRPVNDDSAEAALLKDLQAAVAGVTS